MAGFGSGKDAFHPCKLFSGLKDSRLLHGDRFHVAVRIELGQDRTHAVIAEPAGVIG